MGLGKGDGDESKVDNKSFLAFVSVILLLIASVRINATANQYTKTLKYK